MTRGLWRIAVLAGLAPFAGLVDGARAETWWVSWEGSTYPEQDGWERITYGGGCQRWFQDGTLVLDGRASYDISDFYRWQGSIAPGADEAFVCTWKLRVSQVNGFADPGLSVLSAGHGVVAFVYTTSALYSLAEAVWIPFAPGVFHEYELTSTDMASYALRIDGGLAYQGHFVPSGGTSYVAWGDYVQGASSLAAWDYYRFGVVAEPATGPLLGSIGLTGILLAARGNGAPLRIALRSRFRSATEPSVV